MSGVEENKGANAATNDPSGESPPNIDWSGDPAPRNPPIPDGSAEPAPGNPPHADGESAPGNSPDPNGSAEPAPDNPPIADGSGESAPRNPPTPDGPDESAPENPPNPNGSAEPAPGNLSNPDDESPPDPDGSGSSFEVIPDVNNDNVVTVTTRSSAPGRLETTKFKKKPRFMGGIEVGEDGFPVGPYISLAERMRLEELNNPPDPVRPRELSSSEEEIPRPPSSDEDPNRIPQFPGDTP